jgi:fermentation-respiration switch protein FrsA (DUF1100 family)
MNQYPQTTGQSFPLHSNSAPANIMKRMQPTMSSAEIWKTVRPRMRRRRMRRAARYMAFALGVVLLAYVGLLTFMVGNERHLVYRTARPDEEWHDKPSADIQDVTLRTRDGALLGWYLPRKDAKSVFLICHGQAGNLTARGADLPKIVGCFHTSALVFDYPGYGISEGEPSESGCYAAADAAYDWLIEQKGFKPEQIIIYGESLGGGVAVDLASRRPHAALLLVNTFTSLPEVAQGVYPWIPVDPLMTNRFNSLSKIAKCRSPIFITHGRADHLIPWEHSQRLFERMTGTKELLLRAGMDHSDPLTLEALNEIRDFLIRNGCLLNY